jgi:ABC-type Fe3+-hydroxamate transport system substrate-binding protein
MVPEREGAAIAQRDLVISNPAWAPIPRAAGREARPRAVRPRSLVIPLVRGRAPIALALLCALAGCQESGFDESRETQRPLKVQHAMNMLEGTKVPGVAERPMTLTADALGDTLALGVEPVRAALPGGRAPAYLREETGGVEIVPPLTDLDLAATDAAEPDLILGSKEGQEELYDDLSRIAPTVMTEGDDWKLNLRLHGEALGRTNDAERLLIDWDDRVAAIRKRIVGHEAVSIEGHITPFAVQVLADLGLKAAIGEAGDLHVDGGPEWADGGVLAARAALRDVAAEL